MASKQRVRTVISREILKKLVVRTLVIELLAQSDKSLSTRRYENTTNKIFILHTTHFLHNPDKLAVLLIFQS